MQSARSSEYFTSFERFATRYGLTEKYPKRMSGPEVAVASGMRSADKP